MFKNLNTEALGLSASQSELIELALSFGFKGIDLDVVDFSAQVKEHGLPKARRLLDSAKLKIGAFKLPVRQGFWSATQPLQLLFRSRKDSVEFEAFRSG